MGEEGHFSQRSECVGNDVLGMISRCFLGLLLI